ncbi:MAG: penicillin-binding protein 1A [Rhodobiaceae bacterium]|nr:penicillin-binding protein 1A [Rhodobiaceae bacterium]MCC0052981.1 penicillin-binding protein 1A [Rhodobiaceae bacterium]
MLFRFFGYLFALGVVVFIICAAGAGYVIWKVSADLPEYSALREYEPPVMTRIQASNGELLAEYATQRRLYLPIQAIPDRIIQAFLSAEDKNFYDHIGIDFWGIGRAVFVNLQNLKSGRRLVGASTITQQVAKNFLLTSDQTMERKLKEALLALRIEQAFTKDQILELYLNEIFLGLGAYGVAGASLQYYGKSVHELSVDEAAYFAALPKAPNNYHPFRHPDRAIERRNWVIDRMVENGYVDPAEGEAAKKRPLNVTPRATGAQIVAGDYFAEEVRRELLDRYGQEKLYGGGLSVRATIDPRLQYIARKALVTGLRAYDRNHGYRGPVTTLQLGADWGEAIAKVDALSDIDPWRLAVVLQMNADEATIGLQPKVLPSGEVDPLREAGRISVAELKWARWSEGERKGRKVSAPSDVLTPGDVIYVSAIEDTPGAYTLEQVPKISGALAAIDPWTGRVLALVGGFSYAQSQFNRATQARRQPGSSFKPFVYATALDNGYSPASVVMDAPIEFKIGGKTWRPENYSGKFYGPSTLRTGIERSRNAMTVRLAQDLGMPLITEYARNFGIYDDLLPVLAMALGAGETTVLRLTGAYAILANGGRRITPTLIDRIQDRQGRTIFKHEERQCPDCVADAWRGQEEPEIVDNREQILDPYTAYQVTSMMEGVVQRGTATNVKVLKRPIAGKTGTTNDEKDAWFVGYAPDLVVGVFVGFDTPKPMGRGMTGGHLAAPIFIDFMKEALAGEPPVPFRVPPGINFIPIDRKTGLRTASGAGGAILEAFKPGQEPPSSYSIIGYSDSYGRPLTVSPEADRAVVQGTGGLY